MPKPTQASAKRRATVLHSEITRQFGRCENCGRTEHIQCAHIISRRYSATRVDLDNSFALCAKCHMRFTEHADEWLAFIDAKIGRGEYERLKAKAEAGGKVDWIVEAERLAAIRKQLA